MVKVKNTYILVDFVVLDMEEDLGILLILGRPFLKDTNARIDVGTGRISLHIMGKTMKFNFQNRREVFLIHEDSKKQELWAEPGWDDQDYHPSFMPAWEDYTAQLVGVLQKCSRCQGGRSINDSEESKWQSH